MRAIVSVVGKDMVGILAKVDAECENANMNVIEMSQTLLQDMFVMIMLIGIVKGNTTLADFMTHMGNVGKQSGLTIHVMYEDIFNSIHKIQDGECMINIHDILETIKMIDEGYLDVRIITIGISLLDCCDSDVDKSCEKIYNKVTRLAKNPIKTGKDIKREHGIPIINKRVSAMSIAMLMAVSGDDPAKYAHVLGRCAQAVDVNFIGSYSALVQKDYVADNRELMESIPKALAETEHVCASANVGSTKIDTNMNAVELMGRMVKRAAELTKNRNCISAVKLVAFCNASENNPFTADALHGVGEADCVVNVGVSDPGVVRAALARADRSLPINELADIIKKTVFKVARMGQLVGTLADERLGIPFGIVDLSLASTPAIGDSVAYILKEMGLKDRDAYGTTACLAMPSDVMKKDGVMASNTIGGFPGVFVPVSEGVGVITAARTGILCLEKLEAMTTVCSVGLDMVIIPGEITPEAIFGIIADEAAIGMVNSKATAVHAIPTIGRKAGEELELGGLLGNGPVMNIGQTGCPVMIHRKGRIPTPIQTLKN